MEFEDILKIMGVIAFFIISSAFGGKKKKHGQAAAPAPPVTQTHNQTKSSDDFFEEVRRMLQEAEHNNPASQANDVLSQEFSFSSKPKARKPEVIDSPNQALSSVAPDYFEQEYRREEARFEHLYNTTTEEATAQTISKISAPPVQKTSQNATGSKRHTIGNIAAPPSPKVPQTEAKSKQKTKFDLRQAIRSQIILERPYDW